MDIIDKLVGLVDQLDPTAIVPELTSVLGWAALLARLLVVAGPILMLIFGLFYWFLPAKEANHSVGYRFWFGMGSVEAWRFTQKLAGICWTSLGGLLTIIMGIISLTMDPEKMDRMMSTALSCVIWEAVLIALCCIGIDVVVFLFYDKNGNRKTPGSKRSAAPRKQK